MSTPSTELAGGKSPRTATSIDNVAMLNWVNRAVTELRKRRSEINAMNVFPVPDADTGSNMTYTMESALSEALKLQPGADIKKITEALATGSVRGARGNSGVVISQVLRAVAQIAAHGNLDGSAFVQALNTAKDLVQQSIHNPVPGTVVTVLAQTAKAAQASLVTTGNNMGLIVQDAVAAAQQALAQTPDQLPVLRDAGVVDAGGQGLVVLLETLADELRFSYQKPDQIVDGPAQPDSSPTVEQIAPELEVMFYFTGESAAQLENLEKNLEKLGTSLVIARENAQQATVHIHSAKAGEVIQTAFSLGEVSDLRLESLPSKKQANDAGKQVLFAITPPGELAQLYASAGTIVIPRTKHQTGEDTEQKASRAAKNNEFAETLLSQLGQHHNADVVLLPNGLISKKELEDFLRRVREPNTKLAIIPTTNLVSGIAATAMYDPSESLELNAYVMGEAVSAMRTAIVRKAEKPSDAREKDDLLVSNGTKMLRVNSGFEKTLVETSLRLSEGWGEQLTLLISAAMRPQFNEARYREKVAENSTVDVTVYFATGMGNLAEIGAE